MSLPFPLVEARGSSLAIAEAVGAAIAPRIERSIATYRSIFERHGIDRVRLSEAARRMGATVARVLPRRMDELEALARGARARVEELVLLNARSEILADGFLAALCECTSLACARDGTRPLVAQTWDWLPACRELPVIVRARPTDGPAYVTFAEAGQLAKVFVSAAGLAVGLNFLACPASEVAQGAEGVPVHLLARELVECSGADEAIRRLDELPRGGAVNLVLADRTGRVATVEVSPERVDVLEARQGLVTHANNFEGPRTRRPVIPWRSRRARALAEKQEWLDRERAFSILRDHEEKLGVICSHGVSGEEWSVSASLAALVLEPAGDERDPRPAMWVAGGPPCEGELVRVAVPV